MKIRVKKLGYYNHRRRHPGEILVLRSEKEFSNLWMEKVDDSQPKQSSAKGKKKEPEFVEEESHSTGDADVI